MHPGGCGLKRHPLDEHFKGCKKPVDVGGVRPVFVAFYGKFYNRLGGLLEADYNPINTIICENFMVTSTTEYRIILSVTPTTVWLAFRYIQCLYQLTYNKVLHTRSKAKYFSEAPKLNSIH